MQKNSIVMKRTRKMAVVVLILLAFVAGNITGFQTKALFAAEEPTQFSVFWETWDLVVENFVDREKIDFTKMTYGAIRGMLESLGDTNHTVFFSPEEAKQQAESLEGAFEGIGAYVSNEDGKFTITQPMHNSPAEKAGLVPGDIVLAVNGESIEGLSESAVIAKIRGPAGTSVILSVLHPNATKPVDLSVTRDRIQIDSVIWHRIPGTTLAYVQITQFADDTADELEAALTAIQAEATGSDPIHGIMLDLRNNPGGYLNAALQVGSEFLDKGKIILHQRDAKGETSELKAFGSGLAREIPVIVLINKSSASAAEINAGALRDHGRAKLVGETTAGTGTILNSYTLSDGSVVRIGVTNWLTPKLKLLKDQGVTPDVVIPQETSVRLLDGYSLESMTAEELGKSVDRQFNSALTLLKLQVLNKGKSIVKK